MQAQTSRTVQYIQDALARNFQPEQIAMGLGISPSAVSQLISTHNIKVGGHSKKSADLDDAFDDLEALAAKKLKTALAVCELDPLKLSIVLSRVNGLKRRSQGEGQGVLGGAQAALVQLQLPENLSKSVNVIVSPRNEIVEIEGRTIATIDKQNLVKMSHARLDNLFTPKDVPPQATASLSATALLQASAEQIREEFTNDKSIIEQTV
jgi:hypothetical protein